MPILDESARYHLLKKLGADPTLSQRDLARELGFSVGKVNYCLRALLDKGYVKATNFTNSKNKSGYLYKLTPAGITAKAMATKRFLELKQLEYEQLASEIEELRREAQPQP